MIAATTREGLSRAWAARRLVLLVWLIHLSVAALVAFPFWRVLRSVLAPLPEADVLRSGIHLAGMADLAELRPGLLGAVGLSLVVVTLLGLMLGAGVAGGVLEVLHGRDHRPLGHRFGRGAGRFFGRFVRTGLLVGVATMIVGGLALLPFAHLTRLYLRSGRGPGNLAPAAGALVAGGVLLVALLVLDASRIVLVRTDGRVLPSLRAGLRLVVGHPVRWFGVWLVNATLVAGALALYWLSRPGGPVGSGALLLSTVAVQQAFVVAKTGLRVALLGSESALVERLLPRAVGPRPALDAAQSERFSPSPPPV